VGDRPRWASGGLNLAPRWLQTLGVSSWLLIGVAGAFAIAGIVYKATVGITVPLIIAVVIGVAVAPLVDVLERRRLRRSFGALATMLLLGLVLTAAMVVVVRGLLSQGPQVWNQLTAGVQALGDWLAGFGVTDQQLAAIQSAVRTALPQAAEGVTSFIGSGLSSAVAFLFGTFLSVFMLYYILSDMPLLSRWVGAHVGLRPELGLEIVNDGAKSIRNYFKGSTVVAFVNTVAIVIGLVIFNVPLIGPIAIVTFILAYIPYIGAIISGAFAVLIALGSGGTTAALGVLVFVLVSQNLLQQPVAAWAVGSALDLHPLVVLISTVLGGIVMGVIGATLAAPLTSMAVQATVRLRREREAIAGAGLRASPEVAAEMGDSAE
jgi:predicted PurR-regulated permease PerM